jgi:hypothetical protein
VEIRTATVGRSVGNNAEPNVAASGRSVAFVDGASETTLGDANFAAIFSMIISTASLSKR